MNTGQRKEEQNFKKEKEKKLGNTLTKIFRNELLNYKILSIPFVKHSHGVT